MGCVAYGQSTEFADTDDHPTNRADWSSGC